eukprot:scaffold48_cov311-Pinguiococcus_pyrenoidosus.AAC.120
MPGLSLVLFGRLQLLLQLLRAPYSHGFRGPPDPVDPQVAVPEMQGFPLHAAEAFGRFRGRPALAAVAADAQAAPEIRMQQHERVDLVVQGGNAALPDDAAVVVHHQDDVGELQLLHKLVQEIHLSQRRADSLVRGLVAHSEAEKVQQDYPKLQRRRSRLRRGRSTRLWSGRASGSLPYASVLAHQRLRVPSLPVEGRPERRGARRSTLQLAALVGLLVFLYVVSREDLCQMPVHVRPAEDAMETQQRQLCVHGPAVHVRDGEAVGGDEVVAAQSHARETPERLDGRAQDLRLQLLVVQHGLGQRLGGRLTAGGGVERDTPQTEDHPVGKIRQAAEDAELSPLLAIAHVHERLEGLSDLLVAGKPQARHQHAGRDGIQRRPEKYAQHEKAREAEAPRTPQQARWNQHQQRHAQRGGRGGLDQRQEGHVVISFAAQFRPFFWRQSTTQTHEHCRAADSFLLLVPTYFKGNGGRTCSRRKIGIGGRRCPFPQDASLLGVSVRGNSWFKLAADQ